MFEANVTIAEMASIEPGNSPVPYVENVEPVDYKAVSVDQGSRLFIQKSLQDLPLHNKVLDSIKNDSNLSQDIKDKLELLIGNDPENLSQDQLKLIHSINKLYSQPLAIAATTLSREEIIASVLESVANGPNKFGQGLVPSCTATVAGKLIMNNKGVGHFAELMTNLLIDGSHGKLTLDETGIRREGTDGEFAGASIAECIFRASVMQMSGKALEGISPDVAVEYSDTAHGQSSQGVSFIFDRETKEQIGTFQGMHAEGWLIAQEILLDCGVEFLKSSNDGGPVSPSYILEQMINKGGTHGCAIAYDKEGLHNKHFVEFHEIKDGRVYFSNPHKDLTSSNFYQKADSHRLEADGLESMSLTDFEARLLSGGVIHLDKEPGHFENDYGDESFTVSMEWYRENGNNHVMIHVSPNEMAKGVNGKSDNNRKSKSGNIDNEVHKNSGMRDNDGRYSFMKQSDFSEEEKMTRSLEAQYAWERWQKQIVEKEKQILKDLMKVNKKMTLRKPKNSFPSNTQGFDLAF